MAQLQVMQGAPYPSPPLVPESHLKRLLSPSFRMPTDVLPSHYALDFQPDAQRSSFVGSAYITMRVQETPAAPSHHVTLHALNLRIAASAVRIFVPNNPSSVVGGAGPLAHPSYHIDDEASRQRPFSNGEGIYLSCQTVQHIDISETVLLSFGKPLSSKVGEVFVLIIDRFDGVIATPPEFDGIFQSHYGDVAALSTHLEPTGARRLFPCFDEPAIQTTFQISVIAAAELTVLSNTEVEADIALARLPYAVRMPLCSDHGAKYPETVVVTTSVRASAPLDSASSGKSWHCLRFRITPLLHTCIVGFHVGRFTFLEQLSRRSRVLCRVVLPYTEPSSSAWFALDLATKALDFFEQVFDVRLPLKKMDVVAVETFPVVGMENWGMINLRKDYVVVTEKTPLERRQDVARLIGHEICHQWFGNWVAIEWWSCLWLKEGMCRYFEYVFVNALFPGWGLWNGFLCNIFGNALLADASPCGMHPADHSNPSSRRILDSLSSINSDKGACILKMLFTLIGAEWLRRASNLLLTRLAGSSFNSTDLERCIIDTADECLSDEARRKHIKSISSCLKMVEIANYPYLYIHQKPGKSCTITQYKPPRTQHCLLTAYLQQQRGKANTTIVDLFSAPTLTSFEWTPDAMLTRVTTPFSLPLNAVEWTPGGRTTVCRVFLEEIEHHLTSPAFTSALAIMKDAPLTHPAAFLGGSGAAASGTDDVVSPQQRLSSSPQLKVQKPIFYLNQGGSGYFQCEYDAPTWRRLFELVTTLSEEDHMRITMHFVNCGKTQLGHQPGDTGDRCTLLLEWLLRLTSTPGAMNSFLWDIVTYALTKLVQLVHQYYCNTIVKDFINSLYMPLQRRSVLSFFAQERTVSFQSSTHLSRQLVLRMMQLLCLCDNKEVMEEAKEAAKWSLGALLSPGDISHNTFSGLSNTSCGGAVKSMSDSSFVRLTAVGVLPAAVHSSQRHVGAESPLCPENVAYHGRGTLLTPTVLPAAVRMPPRPSSAPMSSVARLCSRVSVSVTSSLVRALNVSHPSLLDRATFSPPTYGQLLSPASVIENGSSSSSSSNLLGSPSKSPGNDPNERFGAKDANSRRYSCERLGDFSIDDMSHVQAGAIALSHLVSQGQLEFWVAAAAVTVEVLRLDRDELQRVGGGLPVPHPRIANSTEEQRYNILRLVLPAVYSLDKRVAFPFMTTVFHASPILDSSSVMRLYRNSAFFGHVLQSHAPMTDHRTIQHLLQDGADVCGNSYIVSRLRSLAEGNPAMRMSQPTPRANKHQEGQFFETSHLTESTSSLSFSASPSPAWSASGARPPAGCSKCSVLRPATAAALECMEFNCVWMDYCCSYYDQFLREQLHRKTWQSGRNSSDSFMPLFTASEDAEQTSSETIGGVSI